MLKIETKDILQHLEKTFPLQQNFYDFSRPEEDKQEFLNHLFQMEQEGLIKATFIKSNMNETYGLPLEVKGVLITKEGREFMEGKKDNPSIVQHISVGNVPGTLNIAGRDVSITNEKESEKLIELLLGNIEHSNLQPEAKKSLKSSLSNMLEVASPSVIAGLVVESVKSLFG